MPICDGDCDGTVKTHEVEAIDADGNPALCAWPGGPVVSTCMGWVLAGAEWVADVVRAANWVADGQTLGPLDGLTEALADGVMVVRAEQRAIADEERAQP